MDTIKQIGSIAALGSLILSRPAQLSRGGETYSVRMMTKREQLPYRASENRRNYDAQFRMDGASSPTTPLQNDLITYEGRQWIVWRVIPSPAGSHWTVECMAPPTVGIIPIRAGAHPDSIGGRQYVWEHLTDALFYGKTRQAATNSLLTAQTVETVSRLLLTYPTADAPTGFDERWRVAVDGLVYSILSISNDDENPAWRNAVLTRELSE